MHSSSPFVLYSLPILSSLTRSFELYLAKSTSYEAPRYAVRKTKRITAIRMYDLCVIWTLVIEISKSTLVSHGAAAVICRSKGFSLIKFMRHLCCLWHQCKVCLQNDQFKAMEREIFSYAHSCIS
jgi:hypothetical protein